LRLNESGSPRGTDEGWTLSSLPTVDRRQYARMSAPSVQRYQHHNQVILDSESDNQDIIMIDNSETRSRTAESVTPTQGIAESTDQQLQFTFNEPQQLNQDIASVGK